MDFIYSILKLSIIILLFPVVVIIMSLPILLFASILIFSFDLDSEGQMSFAIIVSMLSYFAFITQTKVGGALSDLQLTLMHSLPGYREDDWRFF